MWVIKTTVAWPADGSYLVTFPPNPETGNPPRAKTSVLAEFANLKPVVRGRLASNSGCTLSPVPTPNPVSVSDTSALLGDVVLVGFSNERATAPTAGSSAGSEVATTYTTIANGVASTGANGTSAVSLLAYTGPVSQIAKRVWTSTSPHAQGALVLSFPAG